MSLQNKTIKEIEDIIINQLESTFNFKIPILSKSFNRVLARVLAGVWQINYKVAAWIFLQLFVSTASFKDFKVFGKTINPLKAWGNLIGIGDPLPSTQARLSIDIVVNTPGETLSTGTQFKSTINNFVYITDISYTLTAGTMAIEVLSTQGGTQGNLNNGDPISLVNPLGVIERESVVNAIITAGTDAETEIEYRARIEERFKQRPQGGALVDYRLWASTVTGIYQTYWYTGDIPTYVLGYVAGDQDLYTDRIPDTNLLLAVGDAVDFETIEGVKVGQRRPLGAIIDPLADKSYTNIKPIVPKLFDVDIIDLVAPDLTTVKGLISDALTAYFFEREPYIEGLSFPPVKNTIQQATIIGIIQNVVQANNGSFLNALLKDEGLIIPNYILGVGQLSKLDNILYNGV